MLRNKFIILLALLLCLTIAHSTHKKEGRVKKGEKWSRSDLVLWGMVSGTAVSLIGFVSAFLLLGLRKVVPEKLFTMILQVLFAFSCGALLGEAFIHILPQAYDSGLLDHEHVSLTFISAIILFILIERLMSRMGVSHEHWKDEQPDSTQPSAVTEKKQLQAAKGKQLEGKEPTGFLNLISSLLHNFVDGLAVGVAFSLGNPREFLGVTIGIIAHEIPREMGDVAILLKSRFSARETILSNGFVNLISLVGVILGLNSHGLSPVLRQYYLVFVGGNFVYIASDIWRNLLRHHDLSANLLELVGLAGGVAMSMGHSH